MLGKVIVDRAGTSSPTMQGKSTKCFGCDEDSHWLENCLWNSSPCQKCYGWLKDAKMEANGDSVRGKTVVKYTVEVNVDDISNGFETKLVIN
ncbi:hypothetical protein IFM89_004037 [Coptis chinensis]|uniref:Uncharacterized protein n=1 Tax=Coptis chinensis TaxID=261450 RepID=A0A835GUH8_9MAGN|nr:hypothetical protein IFM89_004037 [Coptis chinensis]